MDVIGGFAVFDGTTTPTPVLQIVNWASGRILPCRASSEMYWRQLMTRSARSSGRVRVNAPMVA